MDDVTSVLMLFMVRCLVVSGFKEVHVWDLASRCLAQVSMSHRVSVFVVHVLLLAVCPS